MTVTDRKYNLIIFDFDGTLADTFDWFVKNIRLMSDKFDFRNVQDHEIPELRNHDAKYMMKFVGFPMLKLPLIATQMRNLMTSEIDKVQLFPGITEMLEQLAQQNFKLAVVSTNSTKNVKHVLGNKISSLIDHFECGVSMFGKEAKLKKAVKKCECKLTESIYIADELRDIEAAHKIGMAFGAVSWGYTNVEAIEKKNPELTFSSVSEIKIKLLS